MVGRPRGRLRGLRDALAGGTPDPIEATELPWLLGLPWCWPAGATTCQLGERSFDAPAGPRPGEVLLVSATPGDGKRGLWQLRRWTKHELLRHGPALFPLHPSTDALMAALESSATMHLPLVLDAHPFPGRGRWHARAIRREGGGEVLRGPSYGLAFALAVASLYMETAVPARWLASAEVRPDGRIARVDALEEKLSIAARWAPGVSHVLVAAEQEDEARALAARAHAPVEVVGAASVAAAFDLVFAGWRTGGRPDWVVASVAEEAARKLALIATQGPPLLDWGAVERPARLLHERLPPGSAGHDHAGWALAIARRHLGHAAPLPWFEVDTDAERAAHRLQAAADSGNPDLPAWLEQAQRLVRPGSPDRGGVILLGAIGRAQATLGDYPAALLSLGRAVAGWSELGPPREPGRPLCEQIRVLGLLEDAGALGQLETRVATLLENGGVDEVTESFLELALGRAWVHAGLPSRGLLHLSPERDHTLPLEVACSMARWRAVALAALGQPAQAAEIRAGLVAGDPEEAEVIAQLARLDDLLAAPGTSDDELTRHLDQLARLDPSIARLRARGGTTRAQAARVAREYPY